MKEQALPPTRHNLRQIPLDLRHRPAMGRGDFLIAPNNQDAVAWIDLWPEWPAPALILYGPVASGKSHLAAVWQELTGAAYIAAEDIDDASVEMLVEKAPHLIIEDADDMIGDVKREKGLFHLYNVFKEQKRSLLLTLKEPPVRRSFIVADLASRLRAAPAVAIREPDDVLLGAILVKLFNDRQLKVGEDVIRYILPRMERSFEFAGELVRRADERALIEKRAVSVPLIREIL